MGLQQVAQNETVLCLHLRYFWHTFPCLHSKNWGMSGDVGSNSWFRSRAPIYAIQTKVTSTAVLSTTRTLPLHDDTWNNHQVGKMAPRRSKPKHSRLGNVYPFSHNHYHRSGRNHPKWKETKNWRDPFSTSRNYGRKGRLNPSKPTGQQVPLRRYQNSSSSKGNGTPVGLEMLWRFNLAKQGSDP